MTIQPPNIVDENLAMCLYLEFHKNMSCILEQYTA